MSSTEPAAAAALDPHALPPTGCVDGWIHEARAALARNSAFLDQLVEGLDVCPFARPARLFGLTTRFVLPTSGAAMAAPEPPRACAAVFEALACSDRLQVVQIIAPRVTLPARDWVASVKRMTVGLNRTTEVRIAAAAFHPELPFWDHTPAALVPLFRRAPDPTIQWIRLDALDAVRSGRPDGDIALPDDAAAAAALRARARNLPLDAVITERNAGAARDAGIGVIVARLAALRGEAPSRDLERDGPAGGAPRPSAHRDRPGRLIGRRGRT